MSRYYYFAATLPTLQFGGSFPMPSAEFLRRGRIHLRPSDCGILEKAKLRSDPELPPPTGSALLDRYYAWERALRNEFVAARAHRLGRSGERWIRPAEKDDDAVRDSRAILHAVADSATPLDVEIALEAARWALIERLRGRTVFDFESIVAYRLQLLILEHLGALTAERGETNFLPIYAVLLEAARTSEQSGDSP
ncbi:MAG: DUF2764 family protein [Candidatus Aminicenantes bacterium]|nr:DUF2764 family protein [Candidatus Aminicenantes bacterium]